MNATRGRLRSSKRRADPVPVRRAATILLGFWGATAACTPPAAPTVSEPTPDATARVTLSPCPDPEPRDALCGKYAVYEDRSRGAGRMIGLALRVLPSRSGPLAVDRALWFLAGGPGVGATGLAGFGASVFDDLRDTHDLVFVDVRGTGGSNGLGCPSVPDPSDLQAHLGDLLPTDALASCRQELEERADLRRYTTSQIVDDLEEVRIALGYGPIDLYGTSYGTRVATLYLQRYTASLRGVVLKGVVSSEQRVGREYGRDADASLRRLFAHCKAQPSCAEAFPDLRATWQAALDRFADGPVAVVIPHPTTGAPTELMLGREAFTDTVRNFLYSPGAAVQLPLALQSAAAGDFSLFAQARVRYVQQLRTALSLGMFLSVICSEDMANTDLAAARHSDDNSDFGIDRYAQQARACEIWPRGDSDPAVFEPVAAELPVLLVSGRLDPVTPPRWAEQVARLLPYSRHVVVEAGGHSFNNMAGCVDGVIVGFLRDPGSSTLDTSCVDDIRMPEFILPGRP